jgi:hypothetical protein
MSEIIETLLNDHNRSERAYLCSLIKSQDQFDVLYKFIRNNDDKKGSYASWVFTSQSDKNKTIVLAYIDDIITWLPNCKTQGILRSMLRSVAQVKAPENNESEWIDLCFKYLMEFEYEIAVKVHAMQILFLYCKKYPELSTELKTVLESGMDNYTAAMRARGRRILKALDKLSED